MNRRRFGCDAMTSSLEDNGVAVKRPKQGVACPESIRRCCLSPGLIETNCLTLANTLSHCPQSMAT